MVVAIAVARAAAMMAMASAIERATVVAMAAATTEVAMEAATIAVVMATAMAVAMAAAAVMAAATLHSIFIGSSIMNNVHAERRQVIEVHGASKELQAVVRVERHLAVVGIGAGADAAEGDAVTLVVVMRQRSHRRSTRAHTAGCPTTRSPQCSPPCTLLAPTPTPPLPPLRAAQLFREAIA